MMVGGGVAAQELGVARKLGRLLKAIEVSTCANWELCFLPTFPLTAHYCHSTVCIHMNVVLYVRYPTYIFVSGEE